MARRITATVRKLKQLARAMNVEAVRCQDAANICVVDRQQHAKNAETWRGRARTCWIAVALLEER